MRLQAFQFELIPSEQQRRSLQCFAGACRFVFNKALEVQKRRFEGGDKYLGYPALCRLLTTWRHDPDTPWLKEAPTHPLQQALKNLDRAFANFFVKRAGFPCFKKKGRRESFHYPDPQQIKLEQGNNRLFLPKLGWLRYRNSRPVLGTVRNVTVSLRAGHWSVSIQTERMDEPVTAIGSPVGIDMGIVRFATLSDGGHLEPINSFRRHEIALHKAQQSMARKVKYSRNWSKAKARVQRVHARIVNVRRDYLHKATTTICNNHAVVVVEELRVRNMTKSAAGICAAPGKHVRDKAGLNKAILDQGWFGFRRQLAYKLAWKGGELIAVPPHHTSQTCPACGVVSPENRRTQAVFSCIGCGYENHADVVGAINILRRGAAMMCSEGRDDARFACVVNGAVRPSSAGTHLCAKSGQRASDSAEGIPFLSA